VAGNIGTQIDAVATILSGLSGAEPVLSDHSALLATATVTR
jgi:hypothetical protein